MNKLLILVLGCVMYFTSKAQEIMVLGGLNMPLKPYSSADILDNTTGFGLNGFNAKLDYIIIKQSKLNFSVGLHYFTNPFDTKNVEEQNNTIFAQKSKYLSISPYTGIGLGLGILYYITPLNKKFKAFSKISLGQLYVNSPEYSKQDSGEYVRVLSNNATSIFWGFGGGIEYAITPQLALVGFVEYFYGKVDFGNIKLRNAAGQTTTYINPKINEQTLNMLNINIGISYKFYQYENKVKIKKQGM